MNESLSGKLILGLILIGMLAIPFSNIAIAQQVSPPDAIYQDGITMTDACGCQQCGCLQPTCDTCNQCQTGGCRLRGKLRTPRRCPKCECENCHLEIAQVDVEKTCFQTEQKVVCIPKVRMPWQKCCPPTTSRSRVVSVLKTHSYKCPGCSYTWTDKYPEPKVASSKETKTAANGSATIPVVARLEPPRPSPIAAVRTAGQSNFKPSGVQFNLPQPYPQNSNIGIERPAFETEAPIVDPGLGAWTNRAPQRFGNGQ